MNQELAIELIPTLISEVSHHPLPSNFDCWGEGGLSYVHQEFALIPTGVIRYLSDFTRLRINKAAPIPNTNTIKPAIKPVLIGASRLAVVCDWV